MAIEPTHPLVRATLAARQEEVPPGWPQVAAAIRERVRATVTPAAPVLARTYPDGSQTTVSTRVLVVALREAIGDADAVVSALDLDVDRGRLLEVDVAVVVRYGVVLADVADGVRTRAREVLAALLPDADPAPVAVLVADVVEGDPRTS